jgi:hypothetical protein
MLLIGVHPGCTSGNAEWVKDHATEYFKESGFQVVGYQGWNMRGQIAPHYGGACVFYTLKKIPDNGILYEGCLQRWGDELHLYELQAVDAINPAYLR